MLWRGTDQRFIGFSTELRCFGIPNLGALQTGSFIVLGRIFDQSSKHNVDRLLKIGQTNLSIFSKAALGARRQRDDPDAIAWLGTYLKDVYVPTSKDFRHLRSLVRKHRATYAAKYRDLRHKLFAHKEVSDPAAVSALFAKTNVRELQRILLFLLALYDALWMLFANGRKPVLRMRRYSVARSERSHRWVRAARFRSALSGKLSSSCWPLPLSQSSVQEANLRTTHKWN